MTAIELTGGAGLRLTLTDLVKYAGASGDFNPVHHDADAAKAAGMPAVFGHGMFSAGLLASALTTRFGLGSIVSYSVRFTSQTWVGDMLSPDLRPTTRQTVAGREVLSVDCRLLRNGVEDVVRGRAVIVQGGADGDAYDDIVEQLNLAPDCGAPEPDGDPVTIEGGPVARFADALHSPEPEYRSLTAAKAAGLRGIAVPPTFPIAMRYWSTSPRRADHIATQDNLVESLRSLHRVLLHGEQSFTYRRPLRVGDHLRGASGYGDLIQKKIASGSMTVLPSLAQYATSDGRPALTMRSTLLFLD